VIVCLGLYTGPGTFELVGDDMTYYGSETKYGGRGQIDWNITILGTIRMLSSTRFAPPRNDTLFTSCVVVLMVGSEMRGDGYVSVRNGAMVTWEGISVGLTWQLDGGTLIFPNNGVKFSKCITAFEAGSSIILASATVVSPCFRLLAGTTVSGRGTLQGSVIMFPGSIISLPTSAGTTQPQMIIKGELTMNKGSLLVYENNGTINDYAWPLIEGRATLNGGAKVVGTCLPLVGQGFKALQATTLIQSLTSLSGALPALRYNASSTLTTLTISRISDADIGRWLLVDPSRGSDILPCGDLVRPCLTIAAAMSQMSLGIGIELVDGGVYTGDGNTNLIDRIDTPLVIRASPGALVPPKIDCRWGNGITVRLHDKSTTEFTGITFYRCLTALKALGGSLSITSCKFDSCSNLGNTSSASMANGAGVHASNSAVVIVNSQFTDTDSNFGAAAISVTDGSSLVLRGSEFTNNKGTELDSLGNAIPGISCISHTSNSAIIISDTRFIRNSGSAIYISSSTSASLSSNEFNGNTGTSGSSILIGSTPSPVKIINCNFSNNIASLRGAAVSNTVAGAKITMTSCIGSGNSAGDGGVIGLAGGSSISITDGSFSGNTAVLTGGGVISISAHDHLTIVGTVFTANSAADNSVGGVLYVASNGMASISNARFIDNVADPILSAGGGAIAVVGTSASVTLVGTTLKSNIGSTGGGVLLQGRNSAVTFQSCITANNHGSDGAMIAVLAGAYTTIIDTRIEDHEASNRGAVYVGQGSNMVMKGVVCTGGSALTGGCLYSDKSSQIIIADTNMLSNTAVSGAAAYLRSSASIQHTLLGMGTATSTGGGLAIDWSTPLSLELLNVTIRENVAYTDGAGIYFVEKCTTSPPVATYSRNQLPIRGIIYFNDYSSGICDVPPLVCEENFHCLILFVDFPV
jgi:hypothetical protein